MTNHKRHNRVPGTSNSRRQRQMQFVAQTRTFSTQLGAPDPSEPALRQYLEERGHDSAATEMAVMMWRMTGLTVGEVINLKAGDLDLDMRSVRLPIEEKTRAPHFLHDLQAQITPEMKKLGIRADEGYEITTALERLVQAEAPAFLRALFVESVPEGGGPIIDVLHLYWLSLRSQILYILSVFGEDCFDTFICDSENYAPEHAAPSTSLIGSALAAIIAGTIEDSRSGDETYRVNELVGGLVYLVRITNNEYDWGLCYDGAVAAALLSHALDRGLDDELLMSLKSLVYDLQRLLWLAECYAAGSIVINADLRYDLPESEDEAVRLLTRLAQSQPLLATCGSLAPLLPMQSSAWLPLGSAGKNVFSEEGAADDPERAEDLSSELRTDGRRLLDHVAVVDVDGSSLRRVHIGAETHGDGMSGGSMGVPVLVDHSEGMYVAQTVVFGAEAMRLAPMMRYLYGRAGTVTTAPALLSGFAPPSPEAVSQLEQLVLDVWGDLTITPATARIYEPAEVLSKSGEITVVRYERR